MRFDWTFAVHDPGLWLLDRSSYRGEDVAWVSNVTVNGEPEEPQHRPAANVQQEARAQEGHHVAHR